MSIDSCVLILKTIANPFSLRTVERLLMVLDQEIRDCRRQIEKAQATNSPEHAEAVIDEESCMVEQLLGLAFVTAQILITEVVTRAKALYLNRGRGRPSPLTEINRTKPEILNCVAQKAGASNFTEIEVIDAAANYFKHREEWPHDWDWDRSPGRYPKKYAQQCKKTAETLKAIGCKPGYTGNLCKAAEILGLAEKECHLDVLVRKLEVWCKALSDTLGKMRETIPLPR